MVNHSQTLAQLVEAGDHQAIVTAYRQAAEAMFAQGESDAGFFFLTHAFVHALEGGLEETETLEARLREAGRL
ncbi:MAG: hypothetical protein AAFY99_01305 [Pseudomonadota bacterium]